MEKKPINPSRYFFALFPARIFKKYFGVSSVKKKTVLQIYKAQNVKSEL